MNKLFKSSNTLLSTLNTGYWVCKRNDFAEEKVANLYDVYISPEGGGLDYFFSVTAKPTMKKRKARFRVSAVSIIALNTL